MKLAQGLVISLYGSSIAGKHEKNRLGPSMDCEPGCSLPHICRCSAAWEIVKTAIENVETFLDDEVYTCPALPPVLFCDNFGNGFSWDSQAKNAEGNAISMSDGFEPAIKDVYSTQYAASSNSEPYWIPALKCYIFTDDVDVNSGSGEDLCGTDRALGWTVYGYHADSAYYSLADGSIEYETYEASTDIVVICPKVLTGESEKVDVLSKVPYTEPSTATELSSILPISSTLFHELFHMTTYWEGEDVGEDAVPNTDYVEDFTYDLFEALDLAMGVLKRDSSSNAEGDGDSGSGSDADSESEDDGDSASYSDAEDYGDSGSDSGSTSSDSDSEYYPSKEAARNAESYVFFAVAWWNYAKSWTEGDSAVFYTGCAESWEWLGPLTSCSDSTTST